MRCEDCEHWEKDDYYLGFGRCPLIEDSNDVGSDEMLPDRVYSWDAESYRSGVHVGKDFGCIHWRKK